MLFKFLRERRAKRHEEEMRAEIEKRLKAIADDPEAFQLELEERTASGELRPGVATSTFNNIKTAVESVTETKKSRRSVQRILDLLPGSKKGD